MRIQGSTSGSTCKRQPDRRLEDPAERPLRPQARPENPPIQIRRLQNHRPRSIAEQRDRHPILRITKATQGIGAHDKNRAIVAGTNRLIRGRQSVGKSGTSCGHIKGRLLGEAQTIMQKTPHGRKEVGPRGGGNHNLIDIRWQQAGVGQSVAGRLLGKVHERLGRRQATTLENTGAPFDPTGLQTEMGLDLLVGDPLCRQGTTDSGKTSAHHEDATKDPALRPTPRRAIPEDPDRRAHR